MSILRKIIDDMYVDPDLLSELDDEQKQILFCKMREEQLRRYFEHEQKFDQIDSQLNNNNSLPKNLKRVGWLLDQQNEPWVWIMGEHPNDRSIDELLESETQEKARLLAEQEAEALRLKEEEELKEKLRNEQLEIERERAMQQNSFSELTNEIQYREKLIHDTVDRKVEEEKTKRTSEIYKCLIEAREKAQEEAEVATERERIFWDNQERKYKDAESQIRLLARKARETHEGYTKRNLSALTNRHGEMDKPSSKLKPQTRNDIVAWYCRNELAIGAGLLPGTNRMASWMHGVLSRQQAEQLLANKAVGAYLIRLSCRVYGYVLSLRSAAESTVVSQSQNDRAENPKPVRHFVIQRVRDGYQLFGRDQLVHSSLWNLMTHHQNLPLTVQGQEILKESVGQETYPPDYQELLDVANGKSNNSIIK